MNKRLLGCTLIALMISSHAWAQSCDCDYLKSEVSRLKAENAFLRKNAPKSVETASVPTQSVPAQPASAVAQKQTIEQVEYSLVRATGNIKAQTVQVDILVKNTGPTRDLQFQGLLGVDASGEQYQTYDVGFGNSPRSKVTTNVPVKAAGVIKKILPSVKSFSVLTFTVFRSDSGPGNPSFEFRNVPIVWK
ncbi:hypothetical protein [Hymenobacter arizonensis]|uniref:DUF4352 domain-containing protein n=1 Tax=Hymenobacter arizonensis TaxID=1227077 RepID=A0A1I5ZJT0_HYMAR|nr:hypothetical protein [Hymenobacter arizonensis]SFQ56708.1 hypothetical protein SAMN04515668_2973 [Hymenobacter arizonensis]